jgi:hypothetical protein
MLKKALAVSFTLYLMSLLTAMAGVEMFGWLTFVLAIAMNFQEIRAGRTNFRDAFFTLGPDAAYFALVGIVLLGYFINAAPDAKFVNIIGGIRYGMMMYGLAYAVRWLGLKDKLFAPFMLVAAVVAIHGIQEFFTGWDYIRNRPVTRMIDDNEARAAGFFGLPTTFGNAISMTLCFPAAAALMGWRRKAWENASVIFGTLMLLGGIALSFTRAAWIGLFFALLAMALYRGLRPFLIMTVTAVVLSGAFFAIKPAFLQRAETIFDMSHQSNSGRLDMWRTNWWMIQDYPILGIGLNDNERRAPEYNEKHGAGDVHVGNAHNTYIQFLSGTGVLGLLAYLLFIGYYLWLTFQLLRVIPVGEFWHRTFVLAALGAQVAMHIVGFMDCNFKSMQVQHQFVAILAILSYLRFVYLRPAGPAPRPAGQVA